MEVSDLPLKSPLYDELDEAVRKMCIFVYVCEWDFYVCVISLGLFLIELLLS